MHTTGKRELVSTSHPVASPLAVGVGSSGVCGVLAHIAGFEPLWQLVYVSWGYGARSVLITEKDVTKAYRSMLPVVFLCNEAAVFR